MKKAVSFILSAVVALAMLVTISAEDKERITTGFGNNVDVYRDSPFAGIYDGADVFDDTQETALGEAAAGLARDMDYNIVIISVDDAGLEENDESAKTYANAVYDDLCGLGTDGVLLLINNDSYYDYITTSGECVVLYNDERLSETLDKVCTHFSNDEYYEGALQFLVSLNDYYDADNTKTDSGNITDGEDNDDLIAENEKDKTNDNVLFSYTTARGNFVEFYCDDPYAAVVDDADLFTETQESYIGQYALQFADETGMNIIIATTEDIGSDKSDNAVINYADDMYDEICGINTDGVLFLINCDTKYDWISTSGKAINYYSDNRIEDIFDEIYDDLVDEDFYDAAIGFIDECGYYYDKGKANNQIGLGFIEFNPIAFFEIIISAGMFAVIAGIIIFAVNSSKYGMKRAETSKYVVRDSLYLEKNVNTSLGITVNRIYSPRSSSSGGSGGRSGRSSTHRSRSGGRHGGGGRRR